MRPPGKSPGTTERWISVGILIVLLAIVVGVLVRQFSFNPAVLLARNIAPGKPAAAASVSAAVAWLPSRLKDFGPPESFTPDNLYDKIDGKAELYLAAGFVGMRCQRFALKDAPEKWLEWFVYDMGALPNAFSVFSTQRRAEGQPLDFAPYAYRTRNALYFVSGSNYVEAVASSADEPLMNAMIEMAGHFGAGSETASGHMPEMEILPTENLVSGTYALQTSDAFGFDRFKNVFTAQYKLDGADVTAFVTSCSNAAAAGALRDAYRAFLIENGGRESSSPGREPSDRPIEIMGGAEVVFSKSNVVAGVHSAPSVAVAERLADALRRRLDQKAK